MVDTGIFATTAEVQRKAGAQASVIANTEAYINDYMNQAESLINSITRFNWSDAYAALDVDVKAILKIAGSAKAAMMVINYDTRGWSTRQITLIINVLRDEYDMATKELKDMKVKRFINKA